MTAEKKSGAVATTTAQLEDEQTDSDVTESDEPFVSGVLVLDVGDDVVTFTVSTTDPAAAKAWNLLSPEHADAKVQQLLDKPTAQPDEPESDTPAYMRDALTQFRTVVREYVRLADSRLPREHQVHVRDRGSRRRVGHKPRTRVSAHGPPERPRSSDDDDPPDVVRRREDAV